MEESKNQIVKLNVGGSLFQTTIATLTKTDSMLRAMFSGRFANTMDSDGYIFIDRNGKHFGTILEFLRDPSIPLPENTRELQELLVEAKYYLIQELIDECESIKVEPGFVCRENIFIKGSPDRFVKLKVEGTPFHATIRTLTELESKLRPMFNGTKDVSIDSEGYVLIEGRAKFFGRILDHLRHGKPIRVDSKEDMFDMQQEFDCLGLMSYMVIYEYF